MEETQALEEPGGLLVPDDKRVEKKGGAVRGGCLCGSI